MKKVIHFSLFFAILTFSQLYTSPIDAIEKYFNRSNYRNASLADRVNSYKHQKRMGESNNYLESTLEAIKAFISPTKSQAQRDVEWVIHRFKTESKIDQDFKTSNYRNASLADRVNSYSDKMKRSQSAYIPEDIKSFVSTTKLQVQRDIKSLIGACNFQNFKNCSNAKSCAFLFGSLCSYKLWNYIQNKDKVDQIEIVREGFFRTKYVTNPYVVTGGVAAIVGLLVSGYYYFYNQENSLQDNDKNDGVLTGKEQ